MKSREKGRNGNEKLVSGQKIVLSLKVRQRKEIRQGSMQYSRMGRTKVE